jgi:hypothetical protein
VTAWLGVGEAPTNHWGQRTQQSGESTPALEMRPSVNALLIPSGLEEVPVWGCLLTSDFLHEVHTFKGRT